MVVAIVNGKINALLLNKAARVATMSMVIRNNANNNIDKQLHFYYYFYL